MHTADLHPTLHDMGCAHIRGLLHGYADKELDLPSVVAVDNHLQSCAACRTIFDQCSALQSTVRRHASYFTASVALADRIRAQIWELTASTPAMTVKPRRQWFQPWQWLQVGAAIAATAALTWTTALQLNSPSQDDQISEQVIASYARSELTGHATDVATSDQHTVKPWLSGRLDFSPQVVDLTADGFPLIGGRLDYLDRRPVATLVYRHRQHSINLYVWPNSNSGRPAAMQAFSRRGYNLLHWNDGGMTYWAISDVGPADLKTFAGTYASAK